MYVRSRGKGKELSGQSLEFRVKKDAVLMDCLKPMNPVGEVRLWRAHRILWPTHIFFKIANP